MPSRSSHHKKSRKKKQLQTLRAVKAANPEEPKSGSTSGSSFPFRGAIKLLKKKNQTNMIEKLKSRKLWVTVLTTVILGAAEHLGLSEQAQWIISMISGSYLGGQGIADAGAQGFVTDIKSKVMSRKLWVTVVTIAITAIGDQAGFPEVAAWAAGIVASLFNVGQGIADSQVIAFRGNAAEEDFGD